MHHPVQVIEQGLVSLRKRAWSIARSLLGKNKAEHDRAYEFIQKHRLSAQAGDWMERQMMALIQTAIQQQGGDPSVARYSVHVKVSGETDAKRHKEMSIAASLVNRSRRGDQVATAFLDSNLGGNDTAKRIRRYAIEYAQKGEAMFGKGVMHAVHTYQRPAHEHRVPVHEHKKHRRPRHPAITNALRGKGRLPFPLGGSGSGSGDSGGNGSGGSDSGSQDQEITINHDQGLNPVTGQVDNPEAAALVHAARAGDRNASQAITNAVRSARSGDPRAQALAQAIHDYTRSHPEFAGEVQEGHVANLSHSHPLTVKRVKQIAASFGAEDQQEFWNRIKNSDGPPCQNRAGYVGQVLGRAQAIQAARFPGSSVMRIAPRAARELGEV
jgi:hypothetical protein